MGNTFDSTSSVATFDVLSATKGAALLTKLQLSPEIGTENASYAAWCLDMAAAYILEYCQIPVYPELSQGYTKSGTTPSTNISALSTNRLMVTVNGSGFQPIEPALASCTSGAAIATELQAKIRAYTDIAGFDEVTVTYTATSGAEHYTLTSGRYGEGSVVGVAFEENEKHVAQALKLGVVYGGEVHYGGTLDKEIDKACVMLAQSLYARQGAEGMTSMSVGGASMAFANLDPVVKSILGKRRRLWL